MSESTRNAFYKLFEEDYTASQAYTKYCEDLQLKLGLEEYTKHCAVLIVHYYKEMGSELAVFSGTQWSLHLCPAWSIDPKSSQRHEKTMFW